MEKTNIILLVIISLLSCIQLYLENRKATKEQLENQLKEEVMILFLYAEKKDWINEDKFNFVVKRIYEKSPELIKKVVKEETIEKWILGVYNNYKSYIKKDLLN